MSLSAINSVSFKGNNYPRVIDAEDYEIIQDNEQATGNVDEFIKDVNKANNDVNVATLALGGLGALAAFKTGSKGVKIARGAVAKFASDLSQGAVNLTSKVFKKIDTETVNGKVSRFFTKFMNDESLTKDSAKMKAKFTEVINAVFGKSKTVIDEQGNKKTVSRAKSIIETLHKNGIFLNGRSLFDNGVALVGAYAAADVVSDVTEDSIDKKNIKNSALKNLNIYKKMGETVVNDLIA